MYVLQNRYSNSGLTVTCAATSYLVLSAWDQLSFKSLHSWAISCLAITTLFWMGSSIFLNISVDFILKMPSNPNASYNLDFYKQFNGFQHKEVEHKSFNKYVKISRWSPFSNVVQ